MSIIYLIGKEKISSHSFAKNKLPYTTKKCWMLRDTALVNKHSFYSKKIPVYFMTICAIKYF